MFGMKKTILTLIAILTFIPLSQVNAQDTTTPQRYTYKEGDPNGIGKWYMGREIAYVMGSKAFLG